MVNVVPRHQQQRVEGMAGEVDGHGRQGGNFHDGGLWVQPGRQNPIAQVAVGDQTKQGPIFFQQHAGDALVAHDLRCL